MSATDDLSGRWLGIFNYPDNGGAVGFTADIVDGGGRLGGEIHETDAIDDGRPLVARIDGHRSGAAVEFTKFYDEADPGGYDLVAYRGTVSGDGNEIAGEWSIPGIWSGSFIMTRPAAEAVEEQVAVGATLPEDVR